MKDFEFAGPTFNAVVKSTQAGDFLGMGAVGERLYGRVFPGLNNNVRHIRVYAAICWVIDFSVTHASSEGTSKFKISELVKTTDILLGKVQLLLTWQAWMDDEKMVPGLSAFDTDKNKWDLTLDGWSVKTTFMNPLYYGPGLVNGLGLIGRGVQETKGTFTCTPAGKDLARAFNEELQKLEPSVLRWLVSTDNITCNKKKLTALSSALKLGSPSKSEQTKFLHLYLNGSVDIDASTRTEHRLANARKRKQSIVLALRALATIGAEKGNVRAFVSVETIRQVMAAGGASRQHKIDLKGIEESWREWFVLQIRQLQRLAMEVLLGLVERTILRKEQAKESSFKPDICEELVKLICETQTIDIKLSPTIAGDIELYKAAQLDYSTLQAAGICSSKHKKILSIGTLKENLLREPIVLKPGDIEDTLAKWARAGKFASNALVYCAIEIDNLRALVRDDRKARPHVEELLSFDSDKLSLSELSMIVEKFKDRPSADFVNEMVSSYVIDQHLRTATARSAVAGDGKNRFIFTQESHGLSRWREGRTNKFVYAQEAHDTLLNALLLLEDCNCLTVKLGAGPQGRYYKDAMFKLKPAGHRLLVNAAEDL